MSQQDISPELNNIKARPLSRLSYQIMGLNLMAILILIAGVFYLDQYKKDLTTAETELLATEAQLYASVVADNAVSGKDVVDIKSAQHLFETFSTRKTQRLILFSNDGKLLLDTKASIHAPKYYIKKAFPGLFGSLVEFIYNSVVDLFSVNFELPYYPNTYNDTMDSFPDAPDALEGKLSLSAWQSREGNLILSAAAPVNKAGNIVGAILVTRADTKIESTFNNMRVEILKFFCGSLLFTLCFSLYLSASIGHPLRKLASAAQAVRENRGGVEIIPDLSSRNDEIGELSVAFRDMTGELQDRIEAIEKFAADVSHELKNPLTSMRSAIETLEKVKKEADRLKLMDIVMHDLVRMDRLISDISRASRLDVELLRDIFHQIDLRDVILPLIDAYRKPLDRSKGEEPMQSIVCEGLDTPIIVSGHSNRLSQVFQNLISNALSFSPAGKPVRIFVKQGPELINIIVEDEGPGIPENRLDKIFERFYTERPDGEQFGSHSGLGLSIVKQIVMAHGGNISAMNRRDEKGAVIGARFIVRLRQENS